jgi:hypothetical protein
MKRFVLVVAAMLLLLTGVMLVRTLRYQSEQPEVKTIPEVAVPQAAAERLAGAVHIPTISHEDSAAFDADAFHTAYTNTAQYVGHYTGWIGISCGIPHTHTYGSRLELRAPFGYCFIEFPVGFPRVVIDRHEDMRPSRLVALLLSFSFALQLLLARDGTTCVMPGADHREMGMATMAQMPVDMSAMDMSLDALPDAPPQESSCNHESATTTCLVMAPCASGFLAIAATVNEDVGALPERIAVATVVMPPSRTSPPELPPPRA